jgi:hypothetical protein
MYIYFSIPLFEDISRFVVETFYARMRPRLSKKNLVSIKKCYGPQKSRTGLMKFVDVLPWLTIRGDCLYIMSFRRRTKFVKVTRQQLGDNRCDN